MWQERAKSELIRVGDGRGFVLTDPIADRRIVVTAAHCLPSFPPSFAASYLKESPVSTNSGAARRKAHSVGRVSVR